MLVLHYFCWVIVVIFDLLGEALLCGFVEAFKGFLNKAVDLIFKSYVLTGSPSPSTVARVFKKRFLKLIS